MIGGKDDDGDDEGIAGLVAGALHLNPNVKVVNAAEYVM